MFLVWLAIRNENRRLELALKETNVCLFREPVESDQDLLLWRCHQGVQAVSDAATITIAYPLPSADSGVDDFRENPLARSLVPLMEMHKQLPKLRVGFLSMENG